MQREFSYLKREKKFGESENKITLEIILKNLGK